MDEGPKTKSRPGRTVAGWIGAIWTIAVILTPAQWISDSCHNAAGGVVCSPWGGGLDLLIRAGLIAAYWVAFWFFR